VCATADSTAVLVAVRAVQGVGAAALLACAASTLPVDGRQGLLAALLPALALAFGPLVGGVFAEQNWWRVFFWAGSPLAAVTAAGVLAAPGRERMPTRGAARLLAAAAGLTAITVAFVQAEVWSSGWWVSLLVAGALLLRLARLGELGGAPWAWGALAGCVAALLFVLPEYFQLARNLSGLRSGALVLAVTLPAVAAWAVSRRLAKLVPPLVITLAGLACAGVPLAVLTTVDADTGYALLIPAIAVAAAGLGAAGGAVGSVPRLESTSDPLIAAFAGAALGLALAGAAFQSGVTDERGDGASFEQALAAGVGSAAFMLVVLVVTAGVTLWPPRRPAVARP
jgi:MFS family permease